MVVSSNVEARTLGILSPTAKNSTHVQPGEVVSMEVALPVALTPPPGVQKAVVWREWQVYLERQADIALGNSSRTLRFELRLLRIRPNNRNTDYFIVAEILHWLPPGTYNLVVTGPGFSFFSQKAVSTKSDAIHPFTGEIQSTRRGQWRIRRAVEKPAILEVLVGKEIEAVAITLAGERIDDVRVYWASYQIDRKTDGRRLVQIDISAAPESFLLELMPQKKMSETVSISGMSEDIRPLEWISLGAETSFKPVQLIWQFVDGDSRVGPNVRYRWMVGTEASVTLTAFNEYATPYSISMKQPLRMPLARGGCACRMPAGDSGDFRLLKFLLQIWVESFSFLME